MAREQENKRTREQENKRTREQENKRTREQERHVIKDIDAEVEQVINSLMDFDRLMEHKLSKSSNLQQTNNGTSRPVKKGLRFSNLNQVKKFKKRVIVAREQGNSGHVIKNIDAELGQMLDLLVEFDRLVRQVSSKQTNTQHPQAS
ncbi:hypothetical protein [Helicobacter suis]|uniref:hypothetical protein n=1 Tax=Helicobacter suis TaxID=104628 RepID=UPI0013D68F11|nr:hypothetical protein [Helicobacter suis]